MDADQDLALTRSRRLHVLDADDVRCPVPVSNGGLHPGTLAERLPSREASRRALVMHIRQLPMVGAFFSDARRLHKSGSGFGLRGELIPPSCINQRRPAPMTDVCITGPTVTTGREPSRPPKAADDTCD